MIRAKAWLVKEGHLETDGRGRMPLRVLPILEEARKNGVQFSDWPKGEVKVQTNSETKTDEIRVVRSAATSTAKTVAEIPEYRFTEDEFKVVESVSGKARSLREACNNCRESLVVCYCAQPMIVARDGSGSVAVTITRK